MANSIQQKDVQTASLAAGLKLLVSLPALNEEETIEQVVQAIPRDLPGVDQVQVLVIDDGSTDGTVDRARKAGANIISHHKTRGVGAAFHTALQFGIDNGADLIVTIDADGQFDPVDIPALIEPVISGEADFATASRFKDPAVTPQIPWIKKWGNRTMSWLVSRLAGQRFWDVSCGFRCYNRKSILNLHLMGRYTYTQEVFMNLAFKQLRIVEVPVLVRGVRLHGRSRVAGNLFRYASNTSRIIFRCYRDYQPLRFFGALAMMLMIPAVGLGLFLLWHYLDTGGFSPHKWAGFVGAALATLALMMFHMGMTGDMMNRHRVYLEELLYYRRLQDLGQRHTAKYQRPQEKNDAEE